MAKQVEKPQPMVNLNIDADFVKGFPFAPIPARGYLCIGKLVSVKVVMNDVPTERKDNTPSTYEYAGKTLPNLVYDFENYQHVDDNVARRFQYRIAIIGNLTKDGTNIEKETLQSLYESTLAKLVHLAEAFSGNRTLRSYEPFRDAVNEWANAIGNSDDVITSTTNLLNVVAEFMNGAASNGKSIFLGKICAMKLLAEYKEGKYFTFDNFVGDGFIQVLKTNAKGEPDFNSIGLSIKPTESSRIVLKSSKKGAPAANGAAPPAAMSNELEDLLKQ